MRNDCGGFSGSWDKVLLWALVAGSLFTIGQTALATANVESAQAASALELSPQAKEWNDDDFVRPDGLPELGKWMIDPDGTVAHWLGTTYRDKHIREPINVLLFDRGATTPEEAVERLYAAAQSAGYPARRGHSSGYRGFIDGAAYDQLPSEPDHAFSNRLYVLNNNHGRVFGPAPWQGGFIFTAAFSRERVAPFDSVKHRYKSFDRARDDFTQQLDAKSAYNIVGFVDMDNAIAGDPEVTTGDHDGQAVLLERD